MSRDMMTPLKTFSNLRGGRKRISKFDFIDNSSLPLFHLLLCIKQTPIIKRSPNNFFFFCIYKMHIGLERIKGRGIKEVQEVPRVKSNPRRLGHWTRVILSILNPLSLVQTILMSSILFHFRAC